VLIINTTEAAFSTKFPTGYTKLYVTRKGRPVKTDQDALAGYHIVPTAGNTPFRVGTRAECETDRGPFPGDVEIKSGFIDL
jgi:hypothetical protein